MTGRAKVRALGVLLLIVGTTLLVLAGRADAHAPRVVRAGLPLEVLVDRLEQNVAHSRGAVAWLEQRRLGPRARQRLEWHRAALGWQLPALRRARAAADAARAAALIPSTWRRLADCETGGDPTGRPPWRAVWDYNGSSGFDGGLQFDPDTWRSAARVYDPSGATLARYPFAYMAPAHVQVAVAIAWLEVTSWLQWPRCSASVGLR